MSAWDVFRIGYTIFVALAAGFYTWVCFHPDMRREPARFGYGVGMGALWVLFLSLVCYWARIEMWR